MQCEQDLGREWRKLGAKQQEYQTIVDKKKEEYKTALIEYQNSKIYKKYIEDLRIWKENNPDTIEKQTRSKSKKSKATKAAKKMKTNNLSNLRISNRTKKESDNKMVGNANTES